MKVTLKNERNGLVKVAPVGFSWTVLLFGWFPTLFRQDYKWFLIMLGSTLILDTIGLGLLVGIAFSFFYNKLYIEDLLREGYKPVSECDEDILRQNGIAY